MTESESAQPPVETAKREKLSNEEIGNLISAGGNHEAKALTLLAMADGRIYTAGDLDRAMLSLQGQRVGWRMGLSTF